MKLKLQVILILKNQLITEKQINIIINKYHLQYILYIYSFQIKTPKGFL